MKSPYGLVADVKMLNFFRDLGTVGAAVILGLVVLSVFVKNAWCRYLCPYGALLGLGRPAEPDAHPPRPRRLHRLREVREGVPVAHSGRSSALGEDRRVHRVPRVRGGLPGQRSARSGGRPQAPRPARRDRLSASR